MYYFHNTPRIINILSTIFYEIRLYLQCKVKWPHSEVKLILNFCFYPNIGKCYSPQWSGHNPSMGYMFLWIFDVCFMGNLIFWVNKTIKASGRSRFEVRFLVLRSSPQGSGHYSRNILAVLLIIVRYYIANLIFGGGLSMES